MKNKKNHLMVGIEHTGYYWLCFTRYFKDNEIKVVLVNSFHVKRSKETIKKHIIKGNKAASSKE